MAEQQLEQALLLTRDPTRSEERAEVLRLQGDVSYWRAAAEMERALEILRSSARLFEEAASKRPKHSTDASPWAEHALFISSEIDKGPRSLRKDDSPKEKPHFQGLSQEAKPGVTPTVTPLPEPGEEPEAAAAPVPDAGVPSSGQVPTEPAPVPDAALPQGGVLL